MDAPAATYAYDYARSKQLFDVLGFSTENTGYYLNGMGGPTLCQSIRYIDIVCSQLTNNQALKDTMSQEIARDVLCRQPETCPVTHVITSFRSNSVTDQRATRARAPAADRRQPAPGIGVSFADRHGPSSAAVSPDQHQPVAY